MKDTKIKIEINGKQLQYANCWNDLPSKDVLRMMTVFLSQHQMNELSFKLLLSEIILDLPSKFWEKLLKDCQREGEDAASVFAEETAALVAVSDYFLDNDFIRFPKLNFTEQKFYKLFGLYGPKGKLKNITFGEWAAMDNLYVAYVKSSKIEILNKLIALMWRPSKPKSRKNRQANYNGDRRQPLLIHEPLLDKYTEDVGKWGMKVRYALFIFIASCRKAIIERYSILFKKNTGEVAAEPSEPINYSELVLRLAGDRLGNDTEVFNKPVHTILTYLEMLEKDRIKKGDS